MLEANFRVTCLPIVNFLSTVLAQMVQDQQKSKVFFRRRFNRIQFHVDHGVFVLFLLVDGVGWLMYEAAAVAPPGYAQNIRHNFV